MNLYSDRFRKIIEWGMSAAYHSSIHLQSSALVEQTVCPACQSESEREPVARIQRDPDVWLLECRYCGLSSGSHLPTDEFLKNYYSTYYGQEKSRGEYHVTFGRIDLFASYLLKILSYSGHGRCVRILDFGGGDGSIAISLAELALKQKRIDAAEIVVVDYKMPRQSKDRRITIFHYTVLEEIHSKFDLVIASAILEHVPNIGECIKLLLENISVSGVMYARAPYIAPFLKLGVPVDMTFPVHMHDIGPTFWARFNQTFRVTTRVIRSEPALVETTFGHRPFRTLAAHVFKAPARLETYVRPTPVSYLLWPFVAGWQAVLVMDQR